MKRAVQVAVILILVALSFTVVMAQAQSDTIIIRLLGNPVTFNPIIAGDAMSAWNFSLIFPRPFEVDRFTGEPMPGLTSWTVSDDGLTYTFTILPDASWSDGTPITAQDFKFTLDAHKSNLVTSTLAANVAKVKEINIIDDKTYEVVFSEFYCTALLDLFPLNVLPAHKFAADYSDFMTSPFNSKPDISGGPYILTEYAPDEFVRYAANPDYYGDGPFIPNLLYRVITDPVIANQSLIAGETDYASMRGEFQEFPMSDQFTATPVSPFTFAGFWLNFADPTQPMAAYDESGNLVDQPLHPIFSDVRVRQAFAMGYSKQDIIATLGDKGAAPTIGSFSPSIPWAYNNDLQPYPYDPEAAAKLLDEAGWTLNESTGIREKDGVPLAFEIAYSPVFAYFKDMAIISEDQLSQLGMDITLTEMEIGALLEDKFFAEKYDVVVMSNGDTVPDPDAIVKSNTMSKEDNPPGGQNFMSYVNLEYDKLVEQAGVVPGCSLEDRGALYHEIQRIQHEDVVIDSVMTPTLWHVFNARIKNARPGPWWLIFDGADEYTIE